MRWATGRTPASDCLREKAGLSTTAAANALERGSDNANAQELLGHAGVAAMRPHDRRVSGGPGSHGHSRVVPVFGPAGYSLGLTMILEE